MAEITSVEQSNINLPDIQLPATATSIMDRLEPRLDSMQEEAIGPMYAGATARAQLRTMAANSPPGFTFGNDVHCSGAGLSTSNIVDVNSYYLDTRTGARSPQQHHDRTGRWPVYKASKKSGAVDNVMTVQTGNTTGPEGTGRARGINGWGDLGRLIGGTLASFRHNFQGLLLAYGELPSIPTQASWALPNLVEDPDVVNLERSYNTTIAEPKNFAPSAAYTYQMAFPSPVMSLFVDTKTDGGATGVIEIWDSNNNVLAQTEELEFPDGAQQTVVNVSGDPLTLSQGRVNINPGDAPNGLTISGIDMTPPAI